MLPKFGGRVELWIGWGDAEVSKADMRRLRGNVIFMASSIMQFEVDVVMRHTLKCSTAGIGLREV